METKQNNSNNNKTKPVAALLAKCVTELLVSHKGPVPFTAVGNEIKDSYL